MTAGHLVLATGHWVGSGGHFVSEAGHRVSSGGHLVSRGGHLVSTMGHRVSATCVHLVGTGGHRVSTAGQLVGTLADVVRSGTGVLRIGGAVVSAANAGETIQARSPTATATHSQQPDFPCIVDPPSRFGTPERKAACGRRIGPPSRVIIAQTHPPVKHGRRHPRCLKGETPLRPEYCRRIRPRAEGLCLRPTGTGHP